MHLANTVRPDESFAVHYLARFIHKPTKGLWTGRKHILQDLKGTKSLRIIYRHGNDEELEVLSDAYRCYKKPLWTSISGCDLVCSGGLMSWRSKQ